MNRKLRRASERQRPSGANGSSSSKAAALAGALETAAQQAESGRFDEAIRHYKRALAIDPNCASAYSGLGFAYLDLGKRDKASAQFAQLIAIKPESLNQFDEIVATLGAINPQLDAALKRVSESATPLPRADLRETISAIASDPLLLRVLQSSSVRNVALEHFLTQMRAEILRAVTEEKTASSSSELALFCALARQCFINEYLFAMTAEELQQLEGLKAELGRAGKREFERAPLRFVAAAMYESLAASPVADTLAACNFPAAVDDVITQQIREPREELRLRDSIPRLTPIAGGVSGAVRQQYEENPYPRWVRTASPPADPLGFDDNLRALFPAAPFRPIGKESGLDILIAGCGTGRHAIEVAQGLNAPNVLAVDLSLASLACAKRKTPPPLAGRMDYAQADIMLLGSIGRSFDLIYAGGVLHHLADPLAGWRELLKLLRPGGIMFLGLYSEFARADVVAARDYISQHGYSGTPADIRRCRQQLLQTPMKTLTRFNDFFSTSECRDLLFHVQEARLTIPQIKDFVAAENLRFIGFEFHPFAAHEHYREVFAGSGWSFADLDRWHAYERENPQTFAGMYHFWVQNGRA